MLKSERYLKELWYTNMKYTPDIAYFLTLNEARFKDACF